jgi:PBP1b-binding outer membrane lipoprotein LpoB
MNRIARILAITLMLSGCSATKSDRPLICIGVCGDNSQSQPKEKSHETVSPR